VGSVQELFCPRDHGHGPFAFYLAIDKVIEHVNHQKSVTSILVVDMRRDGGVGIVDDEFLDWSAVNSSQLSSVLVYSGEEHFKVTNRLLL